jgi:hypothetical protein
MKEGLYSEGKVLIPNSSQLFLALERMMIIFALAPSLTVAVCYCMHLKNRQVQSNVSCQLDCWLVCQLFCSLSQNHCKNKTCISYSRLGWDQLYMSFCELSFSVA